jgi:hypothetical protein
MKPDPSGFDQLARLGGLALSHISVYGLDHEVTRTVTRDLHSELAKALATHGPLALDARRDELCINGAVVALENPLVRSFARHLSGLGITHFVLQPGLSPDELERLLRVLDTNPVALRQSGGFARAVEVAQLPEKVVVQKPPPIPAAARAAAYYTGGGRKFVDFVVGFFGIPSVAVTACIGVGVMFSHTNATEPVAALAMVLALVGLLVATVWTFRSGRRYIGLGIVCFLGLLVAVPLLLVGACFIILARGGFTI